MGLIDDAKSGCQAARVALWSQHSDVWRCAMARYRICAIDVMSLAWEALLDTLKYFDEKRGSFTSTLFFWCRHHAVLWIRRDTIMPRYRKTGPAMQGVDGYHEDSEFERTWLSSVIDVEAEVEARINEAKLQAAIEALKPRYRQVIRLLLAGKTMAETGSLVGVSTQRVDQVNQLAIAKLKELCCGET
jgi:RNA polymerase sigma factor (sigma-70 family)